MKIEYIEHSDDLYQNAPCGYLSMQADGKVVNINNTLLSWLKLSREEVLNKKSFHDLLGIGGKIYLETHMMPLLQMHGDVKEINMELKGNAESRVPVLINGKKVQINSDQEIYRLSIIDITQRKQYEKELLKAKKEAEETNKRLLEINEELEHFAYTASHDLQAPLNNITAIVSLIENKNLFNQEEESAELFSVISNNTRRMRMMINDLLEYSKLDGIHAETAPLSLNEVCNTAIEMLDEEVKKTQAVFSIAKLPVIKGRKMQFIRLFQNLFSNALKYQSAAIPHVEVSYEKIRDNYTFYIKDNGIGFEQKYERKIFQFMERLHSHDDIAGTGIGLSACKRIVEKHGGRIGVSSAQGKGSTFYFTLPTLASKLN